MSFSNVTYTGNGATSVFNVPFPYINQTDVNVQVNGVSVSFTWLTSTQIQTTATPGNGAQVYIYRTTAITLPLVTFADGGTLRAADLNSGLLQVLYGEQEAQDTQATAIANASTASGNLPGVGAPQNSDLLQVVGGVWSLVTPASFRTTSGLWPLTTKGDLWTFGVADGRLAVGSNGTTLIADSTQTTGNKWVFQPVADSSLSTTSSGMAVALNAASGLQISSGLSVKPLTNGGIVVASGGISVRGAQILSADPGSPSDGDIWWNSTNGYFAMRELGQTLFPSRKIGATTADSAAITNTTAITAFNQSFTLPANSLKVGTVIRIRFSLYVTGTTGTPNGTPLLMVNGVNVDGGTFAMGTGSRIDADFLLTIRSIGSGGTYQESGHIRCEALSAVDGQATTFAINTTIANTVAPGWQWAVASASNSVVVKNFLVEKL